jgi:hypothetical protein
LERARICAALVSQGKTGALEAPNDECATAPNTIAAPNRNLKALVFSFDFNGFAPYKLKIREKRGKLNRTQMPGNSQSIASP